MCAVCSGKYGVCNVVWSVVWSVWCGVWVRGVWCWVRGVRGVRCIVGCARCAVIGMETTPYTVTKSHFNKTLRSGQ